MNQDEEPKLWSRIKELFGIIDDPGAPREPDPREPNPEEPTDLDQPAPLGVSRARKEEPKGIFGYFGKSESSGDLIDVSDQEEES